MLFTRVIFVSLFILETSHSFSPKQHHFQEYLRPKRQSTSGCKSDQFRCNDGTCFEKTRACDRRLDCEDGEDESYAACFSKKCPQGKFQCNDGSCIEGILVGDDKKDCPNGEDENPDSKFCRPYHFKCTDKLCVPSELVCNGFGDCSDNSDENTDLCNSKICGPDQFRCDYGVCIEANKVCNGQKNCKDGSDESPERCRLINQITKNVCARPDVAPDKNYTIECPPNRGVCQIDKSLVENSRLSFQCNDGYANLEGNNFLSSCLRGRWSPQLKKCLRKCSSLSSSKNLTLTCHNSYPGPETPCNDTLLEGAVVFPNCKRNYRPDYNFCHQELKIICQKDGSWSHGLCSCVPACGISKSSWVNLIVQGEKEKSGGAPWFVSIYYQIAKSELPVLVCGGTLITLHHVLSAAHCFVNSKGKKFDSSNYYAAVGNYFNRFDATGSKNQFKKQYKIKNLKINPNYRGELTKYFGDLAIFTLSEDIELSDEVFPACVDWEESINFESLEKLNLKVSGFGETEQSQQSSELLTASLPYIKYQSCVDLYKEKGNELGQDKFCAGSEKGSYTRKGDSGGGVLFQSPKDNLFYLLGVTSNSLATQSWLGTYTNIADQMKWIRNCTNNPDC